MNKTGEQQFAWEFKPGDVVETLFGPAYVIDILLPDSSDVTIIRTKFAYNFGNGRQWDNLEITPTNTRGTEKWTPIDKQILFDAFQKRIDNLQKELDVLEVEIEKGELDAKI